MSKKILPNFFIVGAAKAGTTSLYHYLKQHPEIYMSPIKEPNYFAKDIDVSAFEESYRNIMTIDTKEYFSKEKLPELLSIFITDFSDYVQLFRDVTNEKAIGEASVSYLYSKVAAQEIKKLVPNAKIIMVLRNPIERAYSHYLMNLRGGITSNKNFLDEVIQDFNKKHKGWGISHLYIDLGLYYEQVKRYLDTFPKENVKIILYEDYKQNPKKVLVELLDFLEVSKDVSIDLNKRYNVRAAPRFPVLNTLARRVYSFMAPKLPLTLRENLKKMYRKVFFSSYKGGLTAEEKKVLLKFFEEDIKKLSALIQRDLSHWLKV